MKPPMIRIRSATRALSVKAAAPPAARLRATRMPKTMSRSSSWAIARVPRPATWYPNETRSGVATTSSESGSGCSIRLFCSRARRRVRGRPARRLEPPREPDSPWKHGSPQSPPPDAGPDPGRPVPAGHGRPRPGPARLARRAGAPLPQRAGRARPWSGLPPRRRRAQAAADLLRRDAAPDLSRGVALRRGCGGAAVRAGADRLLRRPRAPGRRVRDRVARADRQGPPPPALDAHSTRPARRGGGPDHDQQHLRRLSRLRLRRVLRAAGD